MKEEEEERERMIRLIFERSARYRLVGARIGEYMLGQCMSVDDSACLWMT